MYANTVYFATVIKYIGFITNAGFHFRLKDGSRTCGDHGRVEGAKLHPDELVVINPTLDIDFPKPREPACESILLFERTNLPLSEQDLFMIGRLVKHFDNLGKAEDVPVGALYETMYRHVIAKTGVTEEFPTVQDLIAKKTLCRADIAALIARAVRPRRFHKNSPSIQQELSEIGAHSTQIIRIHNAALRYLSNRARGEPIATQFSAMVQAVGDAQKDVIANCERILDISALLKIELASQSLPYQDDVLYGALIVEAYKTLNDG